MRLDIQSIYLLGASMAKGQGVEASAPWYILA